MRYLSPLRYPGGKARIAPFISGLLSAQRPKPRCYVEAYAGGAAVALHLLSGEYVEEVVLNDLDAGVAAFWRAVFFRTDEFLARLRTATVSVAAWRRHRRTYERGAGDDLKLGFATFFLNRTSRSGILNGRPIGGYRQEGPWAIDVRFNRAALAQRIAHIAAYRSRVLVLEEDGRAVARRYVGEPRTFVYLDPPYLRNAERLYLDKLTWRDHQALARTLRERSGWFLTYDTDARVSRDLYPSHRRARFALAHTAGRYHGGHEFAVFAEGLHVPSLAGLDHARFARLTLLSVRLMTGTQRVRPTARVARPATSGLRRAAAS